jgi:hypothetical protein
VLIRRAFDENELKIFQSDLNDLLTKIPSKPARLGFSGERYLDHLARCATIAAGAAALALRFAQAPAPPFAAGQR